MKLQNRLDMRGRFVLGNVVGGESKHGRSAKRQLRHLRPARFGHEVCPSHAQFEMETRKRVGIVQQGQSARCVHGLAFLKSTVGSMVAWLRLNSLEHSSVRGVKSVASVSVRFAASAACLCIAPSLANAGKIPLQFGCPASVSRSDDVIVQGTDGVFFRQHPDLDMYFPLSVHVAQKLGELSHVLAARGVKLILLPVPARGTAMARHLKDVDVALTQGFDAVLARQSYDAYVDTLKTAGVSTIGLLPALESSAAGKDFFLPADHHWNALGAQTAARSVGNYFNQDKDLKSLPRVEYATKQLGPKMLVSQMRRAIQLGCSEALPMNMVEASETKAATAANSSGTGSNIDIFGSGEKTAGIALAGTSFSDVEAFNFAGYLSEFTQLDVANYAVSGGNQFVSIANYLTSPGFEEAPPKVIIWENPVYNNFGEFGDAPIDELMAAASGACEPGIGTNLRISETRTGISATAVLARLSGGPIYLKFDAGSPSVRTATFRFNYRNGTVLPQTVKRPDRFKSNGRFYARADSAGLISISVDAAGIPLSTATLTTCTLTTKRGS
jgi:alginate biosynthesis protein AlgX